MKKTHTHHTKHYLLNIEHGAHPITTQLLKTIYVEYSMFDNRLPLYHLFLVASFINLSDFVFGLFSFHCEIVIKNLEYFLFDDQ